MRNCVSNKIFIRDVVSGLRVKKAGKGKAFKTANYLKEIIKLKNMSLTANSG